jgi:hypothetical protein
MRRVLCLAGSLALAMTLVLPPVAGAPAANAQESMPPTFWVSQDWNGLAGDGWPAEIDLQVTAHDPEAGAATDIALTPSTDAEGFFQETQVFPGLKPGWFITVTDGVTTKTHTVRDISITDVDPSTDTMRGTADPFTEVYAGGVGYAAGIYTNADSVGEWFVDVTGVYDITPGSEVGVNQTDEDGDFTSTESVVPRPQGWQHNPVTGHDYLYVDDPMSWAEAEEFAVSLGGHLVTINDAAEDAWLVATLGTDYWTGFNDIAQEGAWRWVSGESVTFTNWLSGEPTDSPPGEDAARIENRPPIGWNDLPADALIGSVVEANRPSSPWLEVWYPEDRIQVVDWPLGTAVTLTIDNDFDAANGVLYRQDYGRGTEDRFDIQLAGIFDVAPGQVVTVSAGQNTIFLQVTDLVVTGWDVVADTVFGSAAPNRPVQVHASNDGGVSWAWRSTTADGSGSWIVDFSTPGSEPGEQDLLDVMTGTLGAATQPGLLPGERGQTHFAFVVAQTIPAGTSLTTPSHGTATSGTPTVYMNDPLTVGTSGCGGGTATATLTGLADSSYLQSIPLIEAPRGSGAYTGTFAAVSTYHGLASISISITGCSPATTITFDLYIDPSGVVRDTFGNPVVGAIVTLYRADDAGGPFVAVPDGSAIMGSGNRTNPDLTGAGGLFGWDVTAGYYKVQAEKAGCSAPGGDASVETDVLTIPPPVTDLVLVLNCAVNHAPSGTDKTISLSANGTYTFSVADFGFSDPNDSPPNTLLAVKIATLPSLGSLKLGAVAVTAGQPISVASIPNLTFAPAANVSGSPYATFTFQVQDNGGVANGGVDLDQTANTITLNVTGSGGTKLAFGVQPTSEQAGSAVTPTITVRVLNASNALVSTDNTTVITLSIGTNPNGCTLSGTLVRTAINGVATFPCLSIDKVGYGYRLAASAPPLTGASSNAFNITPGPAVSLRVAGYPSPTNAFVSHTFTVTALDAFGNTATHYTGTVHFTSNDGTAVLPGNYHFNSFDNGVETFSATFKMWSPPNRTITATDVNRPSTNGTQSGIVVSAPTIQHITISPAGSTIRAGSSSSYTVTAYDSPSHSLGKVAAVLSISPDGSCGGSSCTATMAGAHTVTATYGGKTATAKLNVTAGPAAGIVFGQQPTNTISNQTISPAVTVRVVDAYGNLVASGAYPVSIGIGSNPSRGTLSGTTLRFTSGGVATFNTLSINRTGSGYRLVARAPFLATTTSNSFNITP